MKSTYNKKRAAPPAPRPLQRFYAASMQNPRIANGDGWITWDSEEAELQLTKDKIVRLREGDQILASPSEHGLVIHAYRARTVH